MNSDSVFVYAKTSVVTDAVMAGRLDFFADRVDFRYAKSWIESAKGFAFHPELLPLNPTVYSAKSLEGSLSVFRDAGPGAWGREVVKKLHGQVSLSDSLILSNNLLRIGVFRFSKDRDASFLVSPENDLSTGVDIEDIYSAVKAFENGERLNEAQSMLLGQGSSMDGMQPKTFITMDGESWILKLPSKNDPDNKAVNELIGMELARACGIETPEVRLLPLMDQKHQKQALAVKRFDTDNKNIFPLMSAASAMGFVDAESVKRDYRYVAQTLVRMSGNFRADCESLFKRMALNVMISNKDDHIFNQALIMKDGHWRLSPVYDVVCGEGNRRDHAMAIGSQGFSGNLANVVSSASSFGLDDVDAKDIVVALLATVAGRWKQVALAGGATDADVDKAAWAILHKDIFLGSESLFSVKTFAAGESHKDLATKPADALGDQDLECEQNVFGGP